MTKKYNNQKILEDNEERLIKLKNLIGELTSVVIALIVSTIVTALLSFMIDSTFIIASLIQVVLIVIIYFRIFYLKNEVWNCEYNLNDFFDKM
jgi:hypothetical protein